MTWSGGAADTPSPVARAAPTISKFRVGGMFSDRKNSETPGWRGNGVFFSRERSRPFGPLCLLKTHAPMIPVIRHLRMLRANPHECHHYSEHPFPRDDPLLPGARHG